MAFCCGPPLEAMQIWFSGIHYYACGTDVSNLNNGHIFCLICTRCFRTLILRWHSPPDPDWLPGAYSGVPVAPLTGRYGCAHSMTRPSFGRITCAASRPITKA
jgi:hypothetical protein